MSVQSQDIQRYKLTAKNSPVPLRLMRREMLRPVLIAGLAVSVALSFAIAPIAADRSADPDLVRLLKGMALLKGGMAFLAAGLVWWRLGQTVTLRSAAAYIGGTWIVAAAAALIWQLTLIGPAAIAFHAGVFAMLFATLRDGFDKTRSFRQPYGV